MICSLTACNNQDKTMLEGNLDNTTIVELSSEELKDKITNEESFVLIILLPFCSSCENFKNNVINPYILETKATIYGIYSNKLNDNDEYKNKPSFKYAPCILIYKNGENINKINYSETKDEFSSKEAFSKHIEKYFTSPKILNISEETLDNKILNKENFILYIGWNKCGDCVKIKNNVLDSYLKNNKNNKIIYYLETNKYRENRPLSKPILTENATDEEKVQYEHDLKNWNNWIDFATKYQFNTYNDGKVPTLQYYENGTLKEMVVYLNDVIKDDIVVDSYYSELINKNINEIDLNNIHNEKIIEFLDKYYKKA